MANRTALVTGASSGIGAVYADRLARRGHHLVLVARDTARLEALAARLREETGVCVEVLTADLSDRAQLATVEARLRDDDGIGMLINNAGVGGTGPWVGMDVEKSQTLIDVNIVAPTRLLAAVATHFARPRAGQRSSTWPRCSPSRPRPSAASTAVPKPSCSTSRIRCRRSSARSACACRRCCPARRARRSGRGGVDVSAFPAEMLMEVDDLVDAALYGLDRGEVVTIPPLADAAQWDAFSGARLAMLPNFRQSHAAARYQRAA